MVDYLLALSTAVITLSAVVLGSFLLRYRRLAGELEASRRLAKDVWDSVNSRFSVMDARLIDMMAKTEVLYSRVESAKLASPSLSQSTSPTSRSTSQQQPAPASPTLVPSSAPPAAVSRSAIALAKPETKGEVAEGTETERRILQFLSKGPKTSAQIVGEVALTREHTGRLLKSLYRRGLVIRNEQNKPYVYGLTEAGSTVAA